MQRLHQVVIIGGGFGGLHAARSLKRAPVQITLFDRRNFHLFQPLLYQVATGWLAAANIAAPLRAALRRQQNVEVLLGEVVDIDAAKQKVRLRDGACAPYDALIVAAGARHHYFGHNDWEAHAPGLKTVEDAFDIRCRVLRAFEAAERETDPQKQRAYLTFIVVGGGPTGVELAGALAELARDTLKHDFRRIDPTRARVLLLEGYDRILPPYPASLSVKAAEGLERLGVQVRCQTLVTEVVSDDVTVQCDGQLEVIPARTVIWAAGVQASPIGQVLAEATGSELDRAGRVVVGVDCALPTHPNIFVIGDLASHADRNGAPLPGVAPVAMQQG
jgi:NADH dehydrogenase